MLCLRASRFESGEAGAVGGKGSGAPAEAVLGEREAGGGLGLGEECLTREERASHDVMIVVRAVFVVARVGLA